MLTIVWDTSIIALMFSFRYKWTGAKFVLVSAILLACGGGDTTAPNAPAAPSTTPTLVIQNGDRQTVTVGTTASSMLSALVTDNHGAHPAGISVTFTPDSGAGTVTSASTTTDNSGVASAGVWTVGTRARDQHVTASATVDGAILRVVFTATTTPGRPTTLKISSGGNQDGPYGATLASPVQVIVSDQYNNPTPGVNVGFSIDSGGVTSPAATTDAGGMATTRVRLPTTLGQVLLSASADSVPSVTSKFTSRGVRFAKFSMDAGVTCGLSVEGYPYCWGERSVGQPLSYGTFSAQDVHTPQPIPGDLDLTSLTLADMSGCGIRVDGSALCWGDNRWGANGDGHSLNNTVMQFDPMTPVSGNHSFVEIQRGPKTACGTTKTGQSYCWGDNQYGQLGAAALYQFIVPQPTLVDGGITFHSYALGILHSCALDPAGRAYCWGMDLQGRLGVTSASLSCSITSVDTTTVIPPTTCASSPVAVDTPLRFTMLAGATDATCGLDASGMTYCWGSNDFVQLGNGEGPAVSIPTKVAGAPTFTQLVGHDRGFCGLTSGGDIYCWGYVSQLIGVPPNACTTFSDCTPTPAKVAVGRQFSSIVFNVGEICGLSDGVAYCWGGASQGALGIGDTSELTISTPTRVAGQAP